MMLVHLDNDFLVRALSGRRSEKHRLRELSDSTEQLQMSAVAWYEFLRGPRTPEQVAVARALFGENGILPFSEAFAERAAEVFRSLGSPRRRTTDIAIGVTAAEVNAKLFTCNAQDFAGIPGLEVEATES